MKRKPEEREQGARELAQAVADLTGFRLDAIPEDALRRAMTPFLDSAPGDRDLKDFARTISWKAVESLIEQIAVGETFFFRQPAHFQYLTTHFLPSWLSSRREALLAWSAGCASGEEVYSLASCLLACVPSTVRLDVLGTDVLERRIRMAQSGVYGAYSIRGSGPLLYSAVEPTKGGKFRVLDRVRAVTRFAVHDLRDGAPPGGPFDIIFCRNVLLYFAPEVAFRITRHLASSLADDGLLVFGAMDTGDEPTGLERAGPPELNAFRRLPKRAAAPLKRPGTAAATSLPVPRGQSRPPARFVPAAETTPIPLHTQALALIERGEHLKATRILQQIAKLAPDYLPGLLEQALLHARRGRPERAAELMRELIRKTEALPPDLVVEGPEALPVTYYRASAQAFIDRQEVEA